MASSNKKCYDSKKTKFMSNAGHQSCQKNQIFMNQLIISSSHRMETEKQKRKIDYQRKRVCTKAEILINSCVYVLSVSAEMGTKVGIAIGKKIVFENTVTEFHFKEEKVVI